MKRVRLGFLSLIFSIIFSGMVFADDHGNSCSSATTVGVNSSHSGSIETGGDYDYFRVQVPSSGTLTVYTTGDTDTYGYLKNSGCSDLDSDDDGSGNNFLISFPVNAGTYYVAVRHYNSRGTGSYTLVVEFSGTGDIRGSDLTVSIPAWARWTSTGVTVTTGQSLIITASGTWSMDSNRYVGPDGDSSPASSTYPLPGRNLHALIGRIGSTVFYVGSSFSGTAPASGTLMLGMNDSYFSDNDGSLTATISTIVTPNTYTLSVSKSGSGTVTSSPSGINCGSDCSESYANGTSVTLTATPDSGWTFSGWGGACSGTGNTCTISMTSNQSVSATFRQQEPLPPEGVVFDSDRHFVNLPQLNSQGHQTLITLFKFTVKVSNNLIQVTFKDENQTRRIVGLISISIALPETIHVDYQNIQIMADGQSANPPERISLLEFIFELVLGEIPGLDSLLAVSNLSNNLNEIEEGEILRNTLFDTAARNTHDVVIQRFHSPAISSDGANEIILRVPVIGSTSEIINKLRNDGEAAFFFSNLKVSIPGIRIGTNELEFDALGEHIPQE